MKSVIEMLGWIVVWYHAPHHIGGGIVCLHTCSLCAWRSPLLAVSSRALTLGICHALAHGILCPLAHSLAGCILCVCTCTRSCLYVALCASISWNNEIIVRACVFVMISYDNIMRAHKDKTEF